MRIMEKEEADAIRFLTNGREGWLSAMLKTLKAGQALEVLKTDWHAKMPPTTIVRNLQTRSKLRFKFGRMPNRLGWSIQRLE